MGWDTAVHQESRDTKFHCYLSTSTSRRRPPHVPHGKSQSAPLPPLHPPASSKGITTQAVPDARHACETYCYTRHTSHSPTYIRRISEAISSTRPATTLSALFPGSLPMYLGSFCATMERQCFEKILTTLHRSDLTPATMGPRQLRYSERIWSLWDAQPRDTLCNEAMVTKLYSSCHVCAWHQKRGGGPQSRLFTAVIAWAHRGTARSYWMQ